MLRRPKLLALLAYLAASGPSGYRERDELVALFWPELDDFRARRSLRKLLYQLRQALGAGAVRSRGRNQLALDSRILWCDVAAFREALERGESEPALELYRGELLPAFHVPGLADFQEWLDATRRQLQARVAEASWALAEEAERRGDQPRAVAWAHRALETASPYDEEAVRRYVALLDRAGHRAAALQGYEALAQRLGEEMGIAPAPETEALVRAVRERDEAREPSRTPHSLSASMGDGIPGTAASEQTPARRVRDRVHRGTARKSRPVATVARLLVMTVVLGAWWALGRAPAGSLVDEGMIAAGEAVILAEFEAPDADPGLGAVLTEALRIDLLATPTLRVLEANELEGVRERMRLNPAEPFTAERAREAAIREGIRVVLEGEVARVGTGYPLTATLRHAGSGRSLTAAREEARTADELISAIGRLSRQIRARAGESLASLEASPPLDRVTRDRQAMVQAYRRVLELDPDHPAALNNLSNEYAYAHYFDAAAELLERAVRVPGASEAFGNLVRARIGQGHG